VTDSIVAAVRADLAERSARGIAKYGVTLDRTDLSRADWLRHAYEEALDLALYLRRALRDAERAEVTGIERTAWREGVNAAATELRAMAARLRRMDPVRLEVLANAATLEMAADTLAEMPMTRAPTGLEYRGG
jgi:hypothetical protein